MDHGRIVHGRMYEDGPFYPRQYVPPGFEPATGADALTGEQADRFRAEFEKSLRRRKLTILTPLPRRVRLRLAATRTVDHVAIWLCGHGRPGAAERLWRLFGMWR